MPVSKNRRKNGKKAPSLKVLPGGRDGAGLPADIGELPDRRAMERIMAQTHAAATGDHHRDRSNDPLARAQELMYDAWETNGKRKRIGLAKQALSISPLCADAHVLLAEEASGTLVEAQARFEAGVAAGEKALGPEKFEEFTGRFWGHLETRPYMRARAGLARCLWDLGQREDAIGHLQEMLRLNPGDNQGMRDVLAGWLLAVGDYAAVESLLQDYNEPGFANWDYTMTLLKFRRSGPSKEARMALEAAYGNNPHVPPLLTGERRMPVRMPDYYSPGSKQEAMFYVKDNMENWASAEGAVEWLAAETRDMEPAEGRRGGPGPERLP